MAPLAKLALESAALLTLTHSDVLFCLFSPVIMDPARGSTMISLFSGQLISNLNSICYLSFSLPGYRTYSQFLRSIMRVYLGGRHYSAYHRPIITQVTYWIKENLNLLHLRVTLTTNVKSQTNHKKGKDKDYHACVRKEKQFTSIW